MNDEEFLRALEACTLPEREFNHSAHVRVAYLYLRGFDFGTALSRISHTIRRYATHLGKPQRYHETITVAYLALVQQQLCERGNGEGWERFARDNPELFEADLLERYYPRAQLYSDKARRIFLLPQPLAANELAMRKASWNEAGLSD